MKPKYFLYARKSTEQEERQVMSIEAQLTELEEFAKREGLTIVERFVESKSAMKPGRKMFGEMIARVNESAEPMGILAWHPDRLARNSIDGGQIVYFVDIGKLVSLRFPSFWFEPTPQGLFMLQVAFGQSKYYSDNLGENVKRGMRQKLRRGEWPGLAPLGYVNNFKTHTIEPDPIKSRVVRKAFEEFAEGNHTLDSLGKRLNFWGVVSRTGKTICKASLHRMLTNTGYIGHIRYNGETYEGKHQHIVSIATFEAVQNVLKGKAKPRHSKIRHDFPFTGLLRCGECGAAISAQYAHGQHGGTYRYYRCSKRLGPCKQKYLREDLLLGQLKERLQKVAICDDWAEKMSAQITVWEKESAQSSQSFAQNLVAKGKAVDQKLNILVNAFLDGTLDKPDYLRKKDELLKKKTALQQQRSDFGRKGHNRFEPLRAWVSDAHHASKLIGSDNMPEIKTLVAKIGTNRILREKQVGWDWI